MVQKWYIYPTFNDGNAMSKYFYKTCQLKKINQKIKKIIIVFMIVIIIISG